MKKIVISLSLILFLGCNEARQEGISFEDTNGSIIGGTRIDPMSIPARSTVYVGLAYYKNGRPVQEARCSGVLVSRRAILTAAHCFDGVVGVGYDTVKTFVAFGADLQDKSKLVSWFVSDVRIHPEYLAGENRLSKTPYDIAVVTISKDAPSLFTPAKISRSFQQLEIGQELLVLGYGLSSADPRIFANHLKAVTLPLAGILHNSLEARGSSADNTCGGDSGGPIFVRVDGSYYLVGTLVGEMIKDDRLPRCTQRIVITRLDYVKDFIAPYIQQ